MIGDTSLLTSFIEKHGGFVTFRDNKRTGLLVVET